MLTQEEMEEREEAAMELAEEVEEAKEEGKLNLVDIMTILGAAQGRVVNCSEKRPLVEQNMSLGTVTLIYTLKRFLLVAIFVYIIWDVQKIIKWPPVYSYRLWLRINILNNFILKWTPRKQFEKL